MRVAKRLVLLIPALVLALMLAMPAPASANCVMFLDRCYNPCLVAARLYATATGRPAPFNCPA